MNIEKILDDEGFLVYKTSGMSMQPMLYQNRDLVVIKKNHQRLNKYDVALYKRRNQYVLHRVIRVTKAGYFIRGDNTYALENVPEEAILGVLVEFQRNGKTYHVTNRKYILYVYLWHTVYPLRFVLMKAKKLSKYLVKKIIRYTGFSSRENG